MIRHSSCSKPLSDKSKHRLQEFWKDYAYLIINEVLMISNSFLALLSHIISMAKACYFHQFPPAAAPLNKALYIPSNSQRDSVDALLRQAIYEEFMTVVILTQQMQCMDALWHNFLQHLPMTNFDSSAWKDTCLVTPQHAVRTMWNKCTMQRHHCSTHNHLFMCTAHDTSNRPSSTSVKRQGEKKDGQELPAKLKIAIRMKVMMTSNVETDLDITNRA
ncbi:hypothetical protein J3A83DRAFT_4479928 [Scleroderma citrinum]